MTPTLTRIPFAEYLAAPGWNWSTVKHGRTSMKAVAWAKANPRTPTDAMRFGSACHVAVFEPDELFRRYVERPDGMVRRGKKWDEFSAAFRGRESLTAADYARVLAVRDAVRAHPAAAPLLAGGEAEIGAFWTDPTGLGCKGRLDWLASGPHGPIVDLKVAARLDDYAIRSTVMRFGYHAQLAAYQSAVSFVTGLRFDCKLVFVADKPPHDVVVYDLPDEVLTAGFDLWQGLLEQIARCEKTGIWPGISDAELTLELPSWATAPDEQAVDWAGVGTTE